MLSAARNVGSPCTQDQQPLLNSSGFRDCLEKSEPSCSCRLPILSPRCLLLCFAQVLYQWCLPLRSFLCFFPPFISKELLVSFLLPDCSAVTSSSLFMFLLITAQGTSFSFQPRPEQLKAAAQAVGALQGLSCPDVSLKRGMTHQACFVFWAFRRTVGLLHQLAYFLRSQTVTWCALIEHDPSGDQTSPP